MKQIKLPLKFKKSMRVHCSCWHHPYYTGCGYYLKFRSWWKFWDKFAIQIKCPLCVDGFIYKDVWEVEKNEEENRSSGYWRHTGIVFFNDPRYGRVGG